MLKTNDTYEKAPEKFYIDFASIIIEVTSRHLEWKSTGMMNTVW
jgi:hypothetical protein